MLNTGQILIKKVNRNKKIPYTTEPLKRLIVRAEFASGPIRVVAKFGGSFRKP